MFLKNKIKNNMRKISVVCFFVYYALNINIPVANAIEILSTPCKAPIDIALVMDKSASMAGAKFGETKTAFANLIYNSVDNTGLFSTIPDAEYAPNDYHQVGLVGYNNNVSSWALTSSYQGIIDAIKDPTGQFQSAVGSRNLATAINQAYSNLQANDNVVSPNMMVISLSGAPDDLAGAISAVQNAVNNGVRVITIGIALNEISNGTDKQKAIDFIKNAYVYPADCYYVPSNSDAITDCNNINEGNLTDNLAGVISDATAAVCDDYPPVIDSIIKIPPGTTYSIDKMRIVSVVHDDSGFSSNLISWSDNWPNDQTIYNGCSLSGKSISCQTGAIGPFAVGTQISYRPVIKDTNGNEVTIDPPAYTKVATVTLSPITVIRNNANIITATIDDPMGFAGSDEFYVRVMNGATLKVDQNNPSSKMTCAGTPLVCTYTLEPGCSKDGSYTDAGGKVSVYIYVKTAGAFHTGTPGYIASQTGITIQDGTESIAVAGTCSDGKDNDCNNQIDNAQLSCDGTLPTLTVTRDPSGVVYDQKTDLSPQDITFTSQATDSNGIKENIIIYRSVELAAFTCNEGDGLNSKFTCLDANVDGKCDSDTSKLIGNLILNIGPASEGVTISYCAKATDRNNNPKYSAKDSFTVRSRQCYGKNDLDSCAIDTSGKCCDQLCNATAENSGVSGPYNTSDCAKEECNGTQWRWVPNAARDDTPCTESGNDSGCYPFPPLVPDLPDVFPDPPYTAGDPFSNNGCEMRDYNCFQGYCNFPVTESSRIPDGCAPGSMWYSDVECKADKSGCYTRYSWEDISCDDTISYTNFHLYDSNPEVDGGPALITGEPEVLDSKTDPLEMVAVSRDNSGTYKYKINWKIDTGAWNNLDCGSCAAGSECSCDQTAGPIAHDKTFSYFASYVDNSPNKNKLFRGADAGLKYGYYTYSSSATANGDSFDYANASGKDYKGTFKGSGIDKNMNHSWGSGNIVINAANSWENLADAAITWEGFVAPNELGVYDFYVYSDDGVKLFLNGSLKSLTPANPPAWTSYNVTYYASYNFTSYDPIPIKIVWYDSGGEGTFQLGWNTPKRKAAGQTTPVYPIPSRENDAGEAIGNLFTPWSMIVRDHECYDIADNYISSGDLPNLTSCDIAGKCCGGYCDPTAPATNPFDPGCFVDSCSGKDWIYAVSNEFAQTKEGVSCGSANTCSDYQTFNSFYTGCMDGGSICTSGMCLSNPLNVVSPSTCSGDVLTNFSCNPDYLTGTCQENFAKSPKTCSEAGNYDSDGVACNCDCGGYDVSEKFGSSLSLDGVDDYAIVPSVNPTDKISVEAWVKSASSTGYSGVYQIVSKYDAYILGTNGTGSKNMCFIVDNPSPNNWQYDNCFTVTNPEVWHHFVGTFDGSKKLEQLYVDGVLKDTQATLGTAIRGDTGSIFLGKRDSGYVDYFKGNIDEVRIYNRVLSPEEISGHFNGVYSNNVGLLAYWNFNETTGEITNDSSGNAKNGNFSNVDAVLGTSSSKPTVTTSGKYEKALSFDGGDYVDFSNLNPSITLNSKVAVEFWMKWNGGASQMPFGWTSYDLFFTGGNFGFNTGSSDLWGVSSTGLSNRWVHVIANFNNGDAKLSELYIDGVKQTLSQKTGTTGNKNVSNAARMSSWPNDHSYNFNGIIDEFRIYNRAITLTEAGEHYMGVYVNNNNLLGYWNFNGMVAADTKAQDISNNGPIRLRSFNAGNQNNVPVTGQVCTNGKNDDCDGYTDENGLGFVATGIVDSANGNSITDTSESWTADQWAGLTLKITSGTGSGQERTITSNTSTKINVSAVWTTVPDNTSNYQVIKISTECDGQLDYVNMTTSYIDRVLAPRTNDALFANIDNLDIDKSSNKFSIEAKDITDSYGINSTVIEWSVDNWATKSGQTCNGTGVCKVCIQGGDCTYDSINKTLLTAGNTFAYHICAFDNSMYQNKKCTEDRYIYIVDTNNAPTVSNARLSVPHDYCGDGLGYTLVWNFQDIDLGDQQLFYDIQIKKGDNDFTSGPFVVNRQIASGDPYFKYASGENKDTGTAESAGSDTITDNDKHWITDEWEDGKISIKSGAGAGQEKTIHSNSDNQIEINGNWTVMPDATSEYEIKSIDMEYGSNRYYWRVRASDNKSGGYNKLSEWVSGTGSFDGVVDSVQGNEFIIDNSANWTSDEWIGGKISIISGTGAGQNDVVITSNNDNRVKTGYNWSPEPINSVYRIIGDHFTTPEIAYPDIQFSAQNGNNEECLSEISEAVTANCVFGDNVNFHDTSVVSDCKISDSSSCTAVDKSKCVDSKCVACTGDSECNKFDSGTVDYSCDAGTCVPSGTCVSDNDCKSSSNSKCITPACAPCQNDAECSHIGASYICNEGNCEDPSKREWDFYGDATVDSSHSNPSNVYVESVLDMYNVSLKRKDAFDQACNKTKVINLGGVKYPKWNEVSGSPD